MKVVVVVLVVACDVGGGFGGGLVSKSHGLTVMRRRKFFSDFAQNLEIFMHKLKSYSSLPLLQFFFIFHIY